MNNPNFRIGMTAPGVLVEILKANPKIRTLGFDRYIPREGVMEKVPFFSQQIPIARLLYHNKFKVSLRSTRGEIKRNIEKILDLYRGDFVVALLSKVRIGGKNFHIPLMDFRCEKSSDNLNLIREFLGEIGQKRGVILWSGKSYHYYGVDLLGDKDWLKFLGECLLFTGYIDERYIGHRLIDGCGSLRISEGGIRPEIPRVVSIL